MSYDAKVPSLWWWTPLYLNQYLWWWTTLTRKTEIINKVLGVLGRYPKLINNLYVKGCVRIGFMHNHGRSCTTYSPHDKFRLFLQGV
ncbi:hypothetical protein GIB67_039459 [Kingdonia uniflora]|uniref:Uncharacterized protein n=1 Tax=Kingdonia uniflora TaxID=39325 RepID=A0A7J7LIL9_9MAGN|nr:hypothetical protein GIB67_039459 [Kingdonia uniflora]